MAVKVLINRLIKENKIEDSLSLLKEIRIKAMDSPGYISGESLVNHYNLVFGRFFQEYAQFGF